MALPATLSAQGLVRNPGDPRVIFSQTFEPKDENSTAEAAWNEWKGTPVDTIRELVYYNKSGSSSVSGANIYDGSDDWKIFKVRTDSVIVMYNEVEASKSSSDLNKTPFPYAGDSYSVVSDGASSERAQAFEKYGEDGGSYYFKYIAGDATTASGYSGSTHSASNYRRNMTIRGLEIEDQSSYRLTLFIKARKLTSFNPIFRADLMRGYQHQRQPFSMGPSSSDKFSFEKSDFSGEWEKVTLMSYYLNDSVAEAYTYYAGYEWADDWTWTQDGRDYNYIMQPDKFFIRLAFSTDSVEYSLDNVTLTKSWIGGVEHYNNMIRVDFGYETDLKDQAKAALAETGIAAVELPGEYFSVYGYYAKGANKGWYPIDIASAEYHDDGYMYMWSKDAAKGVPNYFTYYDSVLVSFTNPVENKDLRLSYTGKTYPCALDAAWVADGKPVKNFTNELSRLNPNIIKDKKGNPIYSMKQLPPVITALPYEDGSFGLDDVETLQFGVSREIEYDNAGEISELAFMRVTKAGFKEIWLVKEVTDSTVTFMRSAADKSRNGVLVGDYQFEIVNLKGIGTDYNKNNTVLNYHFGEFSTTVSSVQIDSDWRGELPTFDTSKKGCNPASTYVHDAASSFRKGKASGSDRAKSRLYSLNYPSGDPDNCGYILITRSSSTGAGKTANVYTIVHFDQADECKIQFKATGWEKAGITGYLYFYPKPDTPLEDGDDNGFAVLEACGKTELGTFTPSDYVTASSVEDVGTGVWPESTETFIFDLNVPAAGDYMLEWVTKEGNKSGVMIGNFSISSANAGNLSTKYVGRLNTAVSNAEAKLAEADAHKYRGTDYTALTRIIDEGKVYKGHYPSKYDSVVAYINSGINALTERMTLVDLFYSTEKKVDDKLAEFDDDTLGYVDLAAYKALDEMLQSHKTYDCPENSSADITAAIDAYEDAIAALNTRMTLISDYQALIDKTKTLMDGALRKDYDEYSALVAAYDAAVVYDVVAPTDDELTAQHKTLQAAGNAYLFRYDYYIAKTRQAKDLFALAEALGYDFGGDKDGVKAKVDALEDDAPGLTELLREASILQILKIISGGDSDEISDLYSVDLNALIPNYYLYNEAEEGRDMEKNSNGKWRINKGKVNTTAFPGWTVTPSSGDIHPSAVKIGEEGSWLDWSQDGHVFAGGITCSSAGAKGSMTATVSGLPLGYYWIGANLSNNSSSNSITLTTSSGDVSVENKIVSINYKDAGNDSILVAGDLNIQVDFKIGSTSSKELDIRYFKLQLHGIDANHSYNVDLDDQKAKVDRLVTFADAPLQESGAQYYNLNGIKVSAPKAGDIMIRRSVSGNGKANVEKVLIK